MYPECKVFMCHSTASMPGTTSHTNQTFFFTTCITVAQCSDKPGATALQPCFHVIVKKTPCQEFKK